jgi:hypothetical protein
MQKKQEKTTVPLTNTLIKDQIESIREKIAEIKLPIVTSENDNHKFNTEKSQEKPEKFDFPADLDSSDVKVTKVCSGVISRDFCWTEPSGIYY